MPSKASTALTDFITGIHDDKLKDIGESQHTIVKDTDFRLDMQGMTTAQPNKKPPVPSKYNLQVQINRQTKISTLKKHQPATVATYLADKKDDPATIRAGLLKGRNI
ncbi:hypothetical protein V8D89_006190 [Ganoderma adspersum]